jgi:hypothetical protein
VSSLLAFGVPFASTAVLVFFLGLQSLNVNQGREVAAVVCSFCIGLCHLFLYRLMPEASLTQALGFVLGGPVGILASMRLHARLREQATRRNAGRNTERNTGRNTGRAA